MKRFQFIIAGSALFFLACGVPAPLSNQSIRPSELPAIKNSVFPTQKTDTLLWNQITSDALLNDYIDSAIRNNYNIQMA